MAKVELPSYKVETSRGPAAMLRAEWLLTNGMGGFAMGTALRPPTRRYHGLLVCDTVASPQRRVMLPSVVERLEIEGAGTHELSTYLFKGDRGERIEGVEGIVHPVGWKRLVWFEKSAAACEWCWRVGGIEVRKRVVLSREVRGVTVRYEVRRGSAKGMVRLVLRSLVGMRDFHGLVREGAAFDVVGSTTQENAEVDKGSRGRREEKKRKGSGVVVRREGVALNVGSQESEYRKGGQWWRGFLYPREGERGGRSAWRICIRRVSLCGRWGRGRTEWCR